MELPAGGTAKVLKIVFIVIPLKGLGTIDCLDTERPSRTIGVLVRVVRVGGEIKGEVMYAGMVVSGVVDGIHPTKFFHCYICIFWFYKIAAAPHRHSICVSHAVQV